VCVNYLQDRAAAETVVAGIHDAIAVQADIGVEAEVVRLFERVDRELGRVAALVNNAATLESQMRLENMDAARMLRIFSTNAIGTMLCSREAVRECRQNMVDRVERS
jgi:NAD(P)-dependent dehydrogenase (short-subunit alcohol dehydrogenase family)